MPLDIGSDSIPVRHELLEISDPLLHYLRLDRLVQAGQDVGELRSGAWVHPLMASVEVSCHN